MNLNPSAIPSTAPTKILSLALSTKGATPTPITTPYSQSKACASVGEQSCLGDFKCCVCKYAGNTGTLKSTIKLMASGTKCWMVNDVDPTRITPQFYHLPC